ncbi:MAG: hypothetical protein ACREQF_10060, partial [Candidatus Binataceae bacterium]
LVGVSMTKQIAVDVHAHALIGDAEALMREHGGWRRQAEQMAALSGAASAEHNRKLMASYAPALTQLDVRIAAAASLSDAERSSIRGGTAARLLGLGVEG